MDSRFSSPDIEETWQEQNARLRAEIEQRIDEDGEQLINIVAEKIEALDRARHAELANDELNRKSLRCVLHFLSCFG